MAKSKKSVYTNVQSQTVCKNPTLIQQFYGFARAYEIALLGGFSITVVHHPEYTNAPQDFQLVKGFFQGIEYKPKDGTMTIELRKPPIEMYHNRACEGRGEGETLTDIENRVAKAKDNKKPFDYGDNACGILLNRVIPVYQLSIQEVENIKQVAAVIGQLHGSTNIMAEHIAEAIQISVYRNDTTILTESHTIQFGKHISIDLCKKSKDDIQNAIEYLQSLLNI
jgi:hypothetical protein